jgi:hypothetical protein
MPQHVAGRLVDPSREVPEPDVAVGTCRGEERTVRTEGKGADARAVVRVQSAERIAAVCIPEPCGPVFTGGSNELAVWAVGDCIYFPFVADQRMSDPMLMPLSLRPLSQTT